ncbi:hypothetical protein BH09BAC3_BH09BAC3_28960 [soil metagenome]
MKKWFLLLVVAVGCQNNEADFPELSTDEAQQIGATSVVMGAEIREIGPVRPVNYGFLWDTQSDITIASSRNKIILGSASAARKFSIKLEILAPNTKYYYRGFASSVDNTKFYYSGVVSFTTLP